MPFFFPCLFSCFCIYIDICNKTFISGSLTVLDTNSQAVGWFTYLLLIMLIQIDAHIRCLSKWPTCRVSDFRMLGCSKYWCKTLRIIMTVHSHQSCMMHATSRRQKTGAIFSLGRVQAFIMMQMAISFNTRRPIKCRHIKSQPIRAILIVFCCSRVSIHFHQLTFFLQANPIQYASRFYFLFVILKITILFSIGM